MRPRSIFGRFAVAFAALLVAASSGAQPLLLDDVHLVHVEDGRIERSRAVLVDGGVAARW